ncbi:shiftless antiviral inhibitor of ribosomal frameshifting protein isoform X2 [Sceloporus undulatus]|uniref:shiftless antiviral inhibitor of ribosomal frameshifting protein isoform X2 n=1 Tax=Sceloporus undulatus TaxID=8520 RepID=UPI001C4C6EBC|nr:shiftless antiviral inhibitor of ribosomal frameshifting protein isoform X2 [Sceloporus undulatus]
MLEKSVRRLREKFYGKVSIPDAVVLMRQLCNNHDIACKRIILCKDELDDADVRETLNNDPVASRVVDKLKKEEEQKKQQAEEPSSVHDKIKEVAEKLKVLELTEKNVRMFNNAKNNRIPPRDRQFACQSCDNMWWRRVPERKQVSRCYMCRSRYDPVPYNKMWGVAEFQCTSCGHTFRGWAQMGNASPCYRCRTPVFPICIIPPQKTQGHRGRQQHSCFAEDCYNRREPHVPGTHCVHPLSRRKNRLPKVIFPSQEHDSTGSTVATCISQGSLIEDINELILEDLKEIDEEEEDGESNG